MHDIKEAAALARWLEANPQASAEVIAHIGTERAQSLLRLRTHYPTTFGREIHPVQTASGDLIAPDNEVESFMAGCTKSRPDDSKEDWENFFRRVLAHLANQ